jgi:aminoglycoside phosphotransferase (APT) family kinase protein
VGLGAATDIYPWPWAVHTWIDGEIFSPEHVTNLRDAAVRLADFVMALQSIDTAGGPSPGQHNSFRGVPLSTRHDATREAISLSTGLIDTDAVSAAWEACVHAPAFDGPPVWIHGDLLPTNLLIEDGRLSAVIDFGGLGVGDPSCDLIPAWSLFSRDSRATFRRRMAVDASTWRRGRGWALSVALIALPYYVDTNPTFAALARRMIDEVLADGRLEA